MVRKVSSLLAILLGWCSLTWGTDETVRLDTRDPYLRVESSLLVGNKGEEILDFSVANDDRHNCGELWVFDHAELDVVKNRFGDVQFVELPQPGCKNCNPARVRWYHEPTGFLAFDVHVYRRRLFEPCSQNDSTNREAKGATP